MRKKIIKLTLSFIYILLIFINYKSIKNSIYKIIIYYIKNILPSMFPLILISNFINNILKNSNIKILRYLSLLITFAPANAINSQNNKELLFSYNINPLFSYAVLHQIFTYKECILIILINLAINYFLLYKSMNKKSIKKDNYNENIINKTINTCINILGIIIFFNILICILKKYVPYFVLIPLEISNGFILIYNIKNNIIKKITAILLNSFGGLAIFYQIKSINKDANYKLLKNKLLLSIFITIISIILIILLDNILDYHNHTYLNVHQNFSYMEPY